MNDTEYFIILIILTIIMLLFGGRKKNHKIEYNENKFYNLQKIYTFSNKFKKHKETSVISIDKINTLIPNIEKIMVIYLNPNEYFNIEHHLQKNYIKSSLMVLYNYDNKNIHNLELILSTNSDNSDEGLFYNIKKNITITDIYSIYNNSNDVINFAIIIIKKPHWFM
jgi:hypothetical protein